MEPGRQVMERCWSVVWCIRHIEVAPQAGFLLYSLAHRSLKEAPWVGSYSVVQCPRVHLMGQPLYCSAVDAGMWGERGYGDGSTTYA